MNPEPHARRGIFWLASYPKSGNTWFRIVLANVLNASNTPIDLDAIHTGMIASCRQWMEQALWFETVHLTHDELDELRPDVYRTFHTELEGAGFHKIHDAYTYTSEGYPLMPAESCLGALYFIRNPLDVAISYANHSSCTIDEAIQMMANPHAAFCKGKRRQFNQLRQKLLSWSMHVSSWLEAKQLNRLVIRYEDMKLYPMDTFQKALQFLNLSPSAELLETTLQNSSIEILQAQETEHGFCEKPAKVTRFFRKGMAGDWQTTLTSTQIARIIEDHHEIMQQFGYLDKAGHPVLEQS